jgi:hypothetical protein
VLARDTTLWTDDVWVVDSTPVECARSRDAVRRSDLAGWAEYGYCASHSRFFWGLRLHELTAPARAGQTVIADRNYYGRQFEAELAHAGVHLLRPARKGEQPRPGTALFKPLRQVIESINDTFKGQLNLEQHGGHTPAGVWVRIVQRVLALTAAIWHNDHTGQTIKRSLLAYDH